MLSTRKYVNFVINDASEPLTKLFNAKMLDKWVLFFCNVAFWSFWSLTRSNSHNFSESYRYLRISMDFYCRDPKLKHKKLPTTVIINSWTPQFLLYDDNMWVGEKSVTRRLWSALYVIQYGIQQFFDINLLKVQDT